MSVRDAIKFRILAAIILLVLVLLGHGIAYLLGEIDEATEAPISERERYSAEYFGHGNATWEEIMKAGSLP